MLNIISSADAAGVFSCQSEPSSSPVYPPPLSIRRARNKKEEDEEIIDETEVNDENEIGTKRPIKIIGVPKLEKYKIKSSNNDKLTEGCILIEEDIDEKFVESKLDKVIFVKF